MKNEVVKKIVHDELVLKKVNAIQTTDTSNLVNTKIAEIEKKILVHDYGKYITTQEPNKLTVDNFTAILAQAKLATKHDIAGFIKEILIIK